MFLLRVLGGWSLIVAVVALVADLTKAFQGGGNVAFTSLGRQLFELSAPTLNTVQAVIERYVHPFLWNPVLVSVLKMPTFLVFAILGGLLYWAGRKRRKVDIFAN